MLFPVSVKLMKRKPDLATGIDLNPGFFDFGRLNQQPICLCWGLEHGQKTRPFNDAEKDKGQRKEKYIIIGETSHWTSVPPGKLITKHEDGTGKMRRGWGGGGWGVGKLNQLPP